MKAFLGRFAGWWIAFTGVTVMVFMMGITKGGHDEWKHFLTPEVFPGFAITLAAIFTFAAALVAFITGLKGKPDPKI